MKTIDLKNIVTKFYVGTALYAFLDISIRLEHGQGLTEHILNTLEYVSSFYQSSVDPAIAIADPMKNGLSSRVETLYDKINVKTVLNFIEGTYVSATYIHGWILLMNKLK